jgi:putative flippase GtrA
MKNHSQFIKFVLVGSFCALQNIVLLYFFKDILGLHYQLSIIILGITVNSIGFYLNRRYTFAKKNNRFWRDLIKYHTVMIASYFTVSLLMYVFVDLLHIWYLWAFIIVTIIMTVYNFFLHKKWTFK